jgi:hypothetical protein
MYLSLYFSMDLSLYFFMDLSLYWCRDSRIPCMRRASGLREKPRYNNILYSLAGHLATLLAADGSSWEQLVTKHILLPLGRLD